jgi:hypothetical protein
MTFEETIVLIVIVLVPLVWFKYLKIKHYCWCRLFHQKYWEATSGTMDAYDYSCPKCRVTICLKHDMYGVHIMRY